MVDELLTWRAVTSGKIVLNRKTTDLCSVVRRTVSVLSGAGRLGEHVLEMDCSQAWVSGDETRLEQIVTNLLDNAAKYTPAGGRIAVRLRREADQVLLEVEDSGMGIPEDLLPRVFDLFTQGERTIDRAQGGLGLGLALVRRLVELHGGEVSAMSAGTGRGASFPRAPARTGASTTAAVGQPVAPPEKAEEAAHPHRRDNADGRETLSMMLGLHGHEVHEAETARAASERSSGRGAAIVDIACRGSWL